MRSHRAKSGVIAGAIAGVIAAALVLAACGSSGSDGPSASGAGTSGTTPAGNTDGSTEPAPGDGEIDSVTVAFPGSLANLYIGQESGILNYNLAATVQEGLVGRDSTGKIVPALAESWTQPDGTTYVFTLRKDAKFQNGDPVTAQDIVFSIEKAADETASPGTTYYLTNMASAEVTGEGEITVKTKQHDAAFLVNLSSAGALVVTQQKFWEEHQGAVGTSSSLLMGTGPYQVTEFQPDSHVTLQRVDTWWGGVPKVKTIEVNFIPDANTRLAAAQKGDIDIALNVPINQAKQWEGIDSSRVEAINDLSYVGLIFDEKVAPFDDANVRKAIAYAVDKATIADKLLRGYGEVATAIMTPEALAAAYDGAAARALLATIPQYDYDPAKAQQLLDDSAGKGGFTAELTFPNTGPQLGIAAQAIADNLKQIGITLTVREVPIEEWLATIGDGEHGLGFMWYFSTTGDPSEVNGYLLGEGNPNGYASEEATSLLAAAMGADDAAARIDQLVSLEKLSADAAVNAPLWWGKSVTWFSDGIAVRDYSAFTLTGMWGADLAAAQATG